MLEKTRQYVSALSILLFSLCVGLPVWWKTTEVYRCPLPYKQIGALASQQVPPELVFRVSIVDLAGIEDAVALARSVGKELGSDSVSSNSARISIKYIVEHKTLSSEVVDELSNALNSSLEDFSDMVEELVPSSLDCFTIFLVPPPSPLSPPSPPSPPPPPSPAPLVSQHRHAVLPLVSSQSELTATSVQLVRTVFGDLQHLERTLRSVTGKQQDRVDVESMRQLRASHGYHISFTLVNPDPFQLQAHWNVRDATENILLPFLRHPGLSTLGNFTVNSQVFYFTDVKFKPRKDGSTFYVSPSDLPPMISSVESKLASHVSQLPSLNFIVYIPKATEYPLHIRSNNKARKTKEKDAPPPPPPPPATDTFLVPQWGGVVLYNPPGLGDETDANRSAGRRVDVDMEKVMPVFISQLKMLLGLPPTIVPASDQFTRLSGRFGVTDWQVDQLLTAKMVESVSMATTSLVSLVQLLDKVKNMVISDHIQQEVESSLLSIQECYRHAASGDMEAAYFAAKRAMHSAETAFFDPSILELLYFPDDQKFAIYIPLFVPISIPILLSSMTALKWIARGSAPSKAKHD